MSQCKELTVVSRWIDSIAGLRANKCNLDLAVVNFLWGE